MSSLFFSHEYIVLIYTGVQPSYLPMQYFLKFYSPTVADGKTLVKFIYSEKATKRLRNLHLFLTGTSACQKKVEISQNFCGLLRIYELYL